MNIQLKYFGMLAEAIEKTEETIYVEEGSTISEISMLITTKYPKLQNMNFKLAVNQTIANNNFQVKDNDEIALLPPFAGG